MILFDLLSDRLDRDENKPLDKEILVKHGALDGGCLPVLALESARGEGLSIALYYPISQEQYRLAVDRQSAARVNLANLYGVRGMALTGGVESIEDRYYIYLMFDTVKPAASPADLYPGLYRFMDRLAGWLKIYYYPDIRALRGGFAFAAEQPHDF